MDELIAAINEQDNENFRLVESSLDYWELWNGDTHITSGEDWEIEKRLKGIARENGTILTPTKMM